MNADTGKRKANSGMRCTPKSVWYEVRHDVVLLEVVDGAGD